MNWNSLEDINQIQEIVKESSEQKVLIFKHSTSCSISRTALNRLERNWVPVEMDGVKPYYLDLLANRNVSNEVADVFEVEHESPQVLLIEKGKTVYTTSHFGIDYHSLRSIIKS